LRSEKLYDRHLHSSLLCAGRERPCDLAAERGQQFPPSDGDCHTPLPCEVRKGTIPHQERAVFTFKGGRIAGCFHLCRNVRVKSGKDQTKLRVALEGRVFVSGTTALTPIGMGHAGAVCERDRGSRV